MDDLAKAMHKAVEDDTDMISDGESLNRAAYEWAQYCLQNNRGRLRARGLRVSTAILDYLDELYLLREGKGKTDGK